MHSPINGMCDELTTIEARVLCYLEHSARPGFCPSREELSRAVGLGSRGYRINQVLASLAAKQFIGLTPNRSRAITLLHRADGRPFSFDSIWAPVVGVIGASRPRETAVQSDGSFADEAVELSRSLLDGHEDVVTLRVSGDSMVEASISDGDLVVISPSAEIRNGDLVAADVHGLGHTLKYFHRRNDEIELTPANSSMKPLIYHPSRVRIEGRVLLVIRQMTPASEAPRAMSAVAAA